MKAILVQDDRSLIWADVPDPVIKPDEVLVKVEYAALNRADLMQREGDYPPPAGCPEFCCYTAADRAGRSVLR